MVGKSVSHREVDYMRTVGFDPVKVTGDLEKSNGDGMVAKEAYLEGVKERMGAGI